MYKKFVEEMRNRGLNISEFEDFGEVTAYFDINTYIVTVFNVDNCLEIVIEKKFGEEYVELSRKTYKRVSSAIKFVEKEVNWMNNLPKADINC